jgi:hypothetical protein
MMQVTISMLDVNNRLSVFFRLLKKKQTHSLNPNLSKSKLPFAVTGKQEIVQEETNVDFSTIPRYSIVMHRYNMFIDDHNSLGVDDRSRQLMYTKSQLLKNLRWR